MCLIISPLSLGLKAVSTGLNMGKMKLYQMKSEY